MNLWFYIFLASVFVTFDHCAGTYVPECNQLSYSLVMRRITQVTYHTHATVKDAYTRTKEYIDIYKKQIDNKLSAMDKKLTDLLFTTNAIQTQLTALMTGMPVVSPSSMPDASKHLANALGDGNSGLEGFVGSENA